MWEKIGFLHCNGNTAITEFILKQNNNKYNNNNNILYLLTVQADNNAA